jgi:hypothetical protein
MPRLRDLRLHALAARSIEPLQYLQGLERLHIEGINKSRSASPLAPLTQLRWLALDYRTGLGSLRGLVNLERLELMDASLASLRPFRACKKLTALALSGRGVRSLDGGDELEAVEDLFLGRTGVRDLSPLAGLPRLRSLTLISPLKGVDFRPVGSIQSLEKLVILAGERSVESIDFSAGLKRLQNLEIMGARIEDGSLEALFSLPDLKRVKLLGDYGEQVERLRREKPGCDIQVTPLPLAAGNEAIQIGDIEISRIGEGFWSIFQDVSDLLGVENNFDADRKVRRLIRQEDGALYNRLEFDPDADFISIWAKDEADIRRAAEIILAMGKGGGVSR